MINFVQTQDNGKDVPDTIIVLKCFQMFTAPKDEVALVLFGTEGNRNFHDLSWVYLSVLVAYSVY